MSMVASSNIILFLWCSLKLYHIIYYLCNCHYSNMYICDTVLNKVSVYLYIYLTLIPWISLSRFRCVNHNLAIEKMRSTHSREDRICKFCYTNFGSYVVEDDFHFVLLCPLYNHIRSHYIQKYFSHPSPATFISLISSKSHNVIRDIAGFFISCW